MHVGLRGARSDRQVVNTEEAAPKRPQSAERVAENRLVQKLQSPRVVMDEGATRLGSSSKLARALT